jgi:hypothetical protein
MLNHGAVRTQFLAARSVEFSAKVKQSHETNLDCVITTYTEPPYQETDYRMAQRWV